MSSVTIVLPYPDRGLSPNSRLGWRAKARLTAQYREAAGWAAKEAATYLCANDFCAGFHARELTPPVVADVTFYVPDKRKRDADNCLSSIKAGFDGMVDAGLLVGDDSEVFSVGSVSIELGTPPRVEVILRCG